MGQRIEDVDRAAVQDAVEDEESGASPVRAVGRPSRSGQPVQVLVEDEDARRNKAAMLLELLLDTARPSLLEARRLRADTAASPLERLLRLIRFDVTLLASGESNVGSLYLLPEVAGPEFTEFHRIRAELIEVYQALLAETVAAGQAEIASVPRTTALLFSIVEGVILRRADDPTLPAEATADDIEEATVRVLGARRP